MLKRGIAAVARQANFLLEPVIRSLPRFRRDQSGVVAILFALVVLVLVLSVGGAVDYSRATGKRTEIQTACDTALLAAMKQIRNDQDQGNTPNLNSRDYKDLAEKVFIANLRDAAQDLRPTFDLRLESAESEIRGTGEFSAQVPLYFAAAANIPTVRVSGECRSQIEQINEVDIHILADTSASMGLPADVAGRALMRQKANEAAYPYLVSATAPKRLGVGEAGCVFACHYIRDDGLKQPGETYVSTLDIANENNIKLRIDVEREGILDVLDLADYLIQTRGATFRFSISTFNRYYKNLLALPPGNSMGVTTSISDVRREVGKLVMGYPDFVAPTSPSEFPNTWPDNIPDGFEGFANDLHNYILNSNNRTQQYVLLVTDGVRSEASKDAASGLVRPFDQADCNKIKATGATLVVLYTKYLDDSGTEPFDSDVAPFYSDIQGNLEKCASGPQYFAMGASPSQIHDAFRVLFARIRQALRLTQ
jgi:hypothetical protein